MKRKIISVLLAGAMVVGLLAGCGAKEPAGGTESTESTEKPAEEQPAGEEAKPEDVSAELTLWDASWNEQITPGLLAKFNEKYPNIKVNVEFFPSDGMNDKYLNALTTGTGADLLSVNNEWVSTFAVAKGIVNLDSFIADNNVDVSDFYDGAIQGVSVDGSVYAMPYRAETHGIFYNKDLFKEAGTEEMPNTWEEALPIFQSITEKSGGAKGIAIPGGEWGNTTYQLINMILCSGGQVLNEDNTECLIDSPEAIRAAEFFVGLHTEHGVVPESIMENDNAAGRVLFGEKKVASFMSGAYDIPAIREIDPDLNMGTGLVPVFEGNERRTIFAGWSTVIAEHCKNKDAAWLLASFLAEPENSVEYSTTFSARKSMATNEKYTSDPLLANLSEAVQYGKPMPVIPQMIQLKQIMFEKIQMALAGDMTAADAMKEAKAEIDEIL